MADLHMVRHNTRRDSAQCRNPRWRHTHSIRYFPGILTRTPRLVPEGIVAMTNPLGCPAQRVLSIHTSQQKLLQPLQQALLRCTCTITHLGFRSLGTVENYWAEQVSGQTLAIYFHQHSTDAFLSSFPNAALSFLYGEQSLRLLLFLLPLPHTLRVRVWQQGYCLCHLSPRGLSIYQCLTAFYVKQVIKLIRNWLLLQTPFE